MKSSPHLPSFRHALATLALGLGLTLFTGCPSSGGYNLGPTENVVGATGLSVEGGVPVGSWVHLSTRGSGSPTVTVNSVVVFRQDGLGHYAINHSLQWKPGTSCPTAPFAGNRLVSWAIQQPLKKVVRDGNKIFVYIDPANRGTLTASIPSGHSLAEFERLGSGMRSPLSQVGVSVFEISGKNLVLTSAPDGVRRIFTPRKFAP
jgi:hypothetical protein